MRKCLATALVCATALSGCSSKESEVERSDLLYLRLRDAQCHALESCCTDSGQAFDPEICDVYWGDAEFQAAYRTGMRMDEAELDACEADLAQYPCAYRSRPACLRAFRGTRDPGEACDQHECKQPDGGYAYCDIDHLCKAILPGEELDSCDSDAPIEHECGPALHCASVATDTRVCVRYRQLGEACDSVYECLYGSVCQLGVCVKTEWPGEYCSDPMTCAGSCQKQVCSPPFPPDGCGGG